MTLRLFARRRSAAATARAIEPSAPVPRRPAPIAAADAFTPTRPKLGRRHVVGRQRELQRILQALREERAHVVLYSERGRGKTSLSNLVVEALRQDGTVVARHTCEAGSDFGSIVRGLLQNLPESLLAGSVGGDPGEGCEAALPKGDLRPKDVVAILPRLACRSLVCLIDEFDRVEDAATRTRVADTIKQLSDRGVALSFLIVGVSENLEQILGQHPSIQRNLVAVPLPLLDDAEVADLVTRAAAQSGFAFSSSMVAQIILLARGMPYMAQLLGLRLTQAASARGDAVVHEEDLSVAIDRLIEDASPRVQASYASLTAHDHDADMVAALLRIASAPQDRWGRFRVLAASKDVAIVDDQAISARCWSRLLEAEVVQPWGGGSGLFNFADRALMHHALFLAMRDIPLRDGPEEPHAGLDPGMGTLPSLMSAGWQ